jgi:spermidine/putrescine transport system permease protein
MAKIDVRTIEAAQDLGSNGWQVLRRVVLPLSIPGIMSGITMVFVPAVSTFVITKLLGGSMRQMIGDTIETMFIGQAANYNVGAALSLILMILILLSMAIMSLVDKDEETDGMIY